MVVIEISDSIVGIGGIVLLVDEWFELFFKI